MSTKLTERTIYTALINFADGEDLSIDTDVLKAFAEKKIAALDKKAAKARETAKTKSAATDELTAAIADVLTDEYQSIADVTAQIVGDDVTVSKVSYRLNALVKAGVAEKSDLTISNEGSKSRKVVGYRHV